MKLVVNRSDIYMIVAIGDFNINGKQGFKYFNNKYILENQKRQLMKITCISYR